MKLIVGLGNPGNEYEKTRHNIGFKILDGFLENVNWKEKFQGLYYEKDKVIYLKPQTYMNLSGDSVIKFKNYYDISNEQVLIIHDDLDMEFGKLKIKTNTSDGGHNGIKSIINVLKGDNFYHLKFGIKNEIEKDAKDFVLEKFSKSEQKFIESNQAQYNEIIKLFIEDKIKEAMNKYN